MTTTAGSAATFVVVRAWREPEGALRARVGTITDPEHGVAHWEACLGVDQTVAAVRAWLQRYSLDSPAQPAHPLAASSGPGN